MARSDDGMGEILKWGLILGGGYLLWVWWQNQQAAAAPVTSTGTPATTGTITQTSGSSTTGSSTTNTPPPLTTPPAPVAGVVIPAGFSVAKDINNSLSGNVQVNGNTVKLSIITGNAGQTSGVIYNASGQDVTSQFTPAQQQQLVQAFMLAPQGGTGTSGLARVIPIPRGLYRAGQGA